MFSSRLLLGLLALLQIGIAVPTGNWTPYTGAVGGTPATFTYPLVPTSGGTSVSTYLLSSIEYDSDWILAGNTGDDGGGSSACNGTFTFTAATSTTPYGTFSAAGCRAYNNGYQYRQLGSSYSANTNFEYTFQFEFPSAADLTASQAIEFELHQVVSGQIHNMAWQCEWTNTKVWRYFDYATSAWLSTSIPCTRALYPAGSWHTVDAKWTRTATTTTHVSLAVDGTVNAVGITQASVSTSTYDFLNMAFQLDSNDNGSGNLPTPYTLNVRDMAVGIN